jgi:PAS domain-containing protein
MASLTSINARRVRPKSRTADELKSASLKTGHLLDLLPVPLALWSEDRRAAIYNRPLQRLLGVREQSSNGGLRWIARVIPADRDRIAAAWQCLTRTQTQTICCYRFLPFKRDQVIWLRETAFLVEGAHGTGLVCSHYATISQNAAADSDTARLDELFSSFTHEIANTLQMIGAEIELSRLDGSLPEHSGQRINGGLKQIGHMIGDIAEYVAPKNDIIARTEDPATAIAEVMRASEAELTRQGIRLHFALHQRLPKLRLGGEFRSALGRLIDFSRLLLQDGGELTITARLREMDARRYLEMSIINAAPSSLPVKESEVFRPYLKLNQQSVGLSLTLARQILRRHCGTVEFRKEQENCGVFSVLIEVPS